MAAKKKAAKAASKARDATSNPYIQRVIEDDELRDNVRVAVDSVRTAYGRLANGKAPAKALLEDKKLQKNLREAAVAMRDAGTSLRDGPKKRRRRRGFGTVLVVGAVGAGLALALSEGLRNKVLDALFGAEEEFEYTSTTSPSSPAPDSVAA